MKNNEHFVYSTFINNSLMDFRCCNRIYTYRCNRYRWCVKSFNTIWIFAFKWNENYLIYRICNYAKLHHTSTYVTHRKNKVSIDRHRNEFYSMFQLFKFVLLAIFFFPPLFINSLTNSLRIVNIWSFTNQAVDKRVEQLVMINGLNQRKNSIRLWESSLNDFHVNYLKIDERRQKIAYKIEKLYQNRPLWFQFFPMVLTYSPYW